MRCSTIWISVWDLSEKGLHFHTQHNRCVRKVDLNRVVFSDKKDRHIQLDDGKEQDSNDITSAK
jgi:choloylglycine hydrolase